MEEDRELLKTQWLEALQRWLRYTGDNLEIQRQLRVRMRLLQDKLYGPDGMEAKWQEKKCRTKASIIIQACWRKYQAYKHYKKLKGAAVMIQCSWRRKIAIARAKIRRDVLEEKKRMVLEEIRRKEAARKKLLELEERITKRQEESKKQDKRAKMELEELSKGRKQVQQVKPISCDQDQRWECKYKKSNIRNYQNGHHGYGDKGVILHQLAGGWQSQDGWEEQIPCKDFMTKGILKSTPLLEDSKHASKLHDPRIASDEVIDACTLVIIEERSRIICLNLSYTCLKIIEPSWKSIPIWVPSLSYQMIHREVVLDFYNNFCECRKEGQMSTRDISFQQGTIVEHCNQKTNKSSKDLIKWTNVPKKKRGGRHLCKELKSYFGEEVDHHGREIPAKEPQSSQKSTKVANKGRSTKGTSICTRQQRMKERGKRIIRWMNLQKDKATWTDTSIRHKWPNLDFITESIIQVHTKQRRQQAIHEYLIKWTNLPSEKAMWESTITRNNWPIIRYEDAAFLQEGEICCDPKHMVG